MRLSGISGKPFFVLQEIPVTKKTNAPMMSLTQDARADRIHNVYYEGNPPRIKKTWELLSAGLFS